MRSLSELKAKSLPTTPLEQVVQDFLTPEISTQALEAAKELSAGELQQGLEVYLDPSTEALWLSCLSLTSAPIFLKTSPESRLLALTWLREQSECQRIKGKLHLATRYFQCENDALQAILEAWAPTIVESEISRAIAQLELLGEDLNHNLPVALIPAPEGLELVLGQQAALPTATSPWSEAFTKPVAMVVLAGILFSSSALAGPEDEDRAVKAATQAALIQSGLQEDFDRVQKALEEKAKLAAKEMGAEVPAAVLGYGLKVAKDKSLNFKGDVESINYQVSAGTRDIKLRLGTEGKQSQYWLQGVQTKDEKKVEFGLKFSF